MNGAKAQKTVKENLSLNKKKESVALQHVHPFIEGCPVGICHRHWFTVND